jgi:hypothetical protein
MPEAKYHAAVKQLKKQLILTALEEAKRQLHRGRAGPGSSRQLSAPVDSQSGVADFDSLRPHSSQRGKIWDGLG